jgi:hypothetical protein
MTSRGGQLATAIMKESGRMAGLKISKPGEAYGRPACTDQLAGMCEPC